MRLVAPIALLFLGWTDTSAQSAVKFMGRDVTIVQPDQGKDALLPTVPASVCIEGPPQRQCYTAPEDFRKFPAVEVVQLNKDTPALLFSAAGDGISDWPVHFALLRPGTGKNLEDLLDYKLSVSNQNQHAFWNEATISGAHLFATADYVWGLGESHYEDHRYIISVYSFDLEGSHYWLADRYMTVRKYNLENADILVSEKQEILARLRRIKAEMERENKAR